jgi:iron-sulfur cluster assembly protein
MNEATEKTKTLPIGLTPGAIHELKKIRVQENVPEEYGLRVGVKGGGCSGFSYILGFDAKKDNDDEFAMDGMRIFLAKAHAIYIMGMEIDYVDGLNNRGFTFSNPNAADTCGCGTSFST